MGVSYERKDKYDINDLLQIMEILRKLHTEGRTVILITHDDKIAQSAKRIIRIMDGKIESDSGMADKNSMEEENGEE